jgi:mRNA interferase RelE/StbE
MSNGPPYRVDVKPSAAKALRKLPNDIRAKLQAKIRSLATNPRPHGAIKLVDKGDIYPVRFGNYRVIYRIEDDQLIVIVVDVGDRKDVYGGS